MAGLQLTTAAGFFKGADTGPVVVNGDPENSRLIRAVRYQDTIKMPPTGKLTAEEIEDLTEWVKMGTPWPNAELERAQATLPMESSEPDREQVDHWAFQSIQDHEPPQITDGDWVQTSIDSFILAKMEDNGIKPAPRASKLVLLRRAKFDLHGLPPTLDEIEAFLSDKDPGAYARFIDGLLASPHYGERWGRHWLDVARYADSTGVDEDVPYVHAWRYRDYVIDAFNRDLPFDRFIREQVAGDLLPAENGEEINKRGIIATGFLALGPKALAQQDKVKMLYDVVNEQIDTTSKAFLGLTISCARCHDHKFDPISTRDYYSLASIFASTRTYEDVESHDSRIYFVPLVEKEIADRYRTHQMKIRGTGRVIDTVTSLGFERSIEKGLARRLADSMVAAREVYDDNRSLEEVARQHDLEPAVLNKWVEYLKPGDEPRDHLERWHRAEAARVRKIAEQYQESFLKVLRERILRRTAWLDEVEGRLRAGERLSPESRLDLPRDAFHSDLTDDEGPFAVDEDEQEKFLPAETQERVAPLRAELKDLKDSLPAAPPMACGVGEGNFIEQPVFVGGSHRNRGEIVPKQFPVVLAGGQQTPIRKGSGRRELAEWLTSESNPLPARVIVNRIWQWHFGEGLVRTPNNFGTVGEPPTHPRLLDYLASHFIEDGWSIKRMHRLIMLSSTYQMSSVISEDAWKLDAPNLYWSRFNRRRLTLEELRDGLLSLDDSLDLTVGGNIEPESANFTEEQRNNRRVNPDGTRRRSVYLPLYRNKLPTVLNLFDFGDATTSTGKRTQTNIAPQTLYLTNSQFIEERSESFAKYLLGDENLEDTARIEKAYRIVLARKPKPEEIKLVLDYFESYPGRPGEDLDPQQAAWKSFCKTLMASNEFHFVD